MFVFYYKCVAKLDSNTKAKDIFYILNSGMFYILNIKYSFRSSIICLVKMKYSYTFLFVFHILLTIYLFLMFIELPLRDEKYNDYLIRVNYLGR